MKSPKPNPSEFTSCAARSNGRKTRSTVSLSIPMPVSQISTNSFPVVYSVQKPIVPDGVNFTAFVSKLSNICSSLSASPLTVTLQFLCSRLNNNALSLALRAYSSETLPSNFSRRKGTSLRMSRVSLILYTSIRLFTKRRMC